MTFFLGRALTQGRAAGLAAVAGATTGLLVHTALVALGISALIVAAPTRVPRAEASPARSTCSGSRVQAIRRGSALTLCRSRGADGRPAGDLGLRGRDQPARTRRSVLFFMTFLPQFVAGRGRGRQALRARRIFVAGRPAVNLASCSPPTAFAAGMRGTAPRRPRPSTGCSPRSSPPSPPQLLLRPRR